MSAIGNRLIDHAGIAKSYRNADDKDYLIQEQTDPLRLFHSAKPNFGPYDAYWKDLLAKAIELYNQQSGTIDPAIEQGWGSAIASANDPENTALLTNARDYANTVLSGYFLNPETNLAMAQALQRGLESARAFDSQAAQAGRYGSGAWGQMKGRNLADLQGNLYGTGINQMTNMANNAASIYGAQYLPAQTLIDVGNQRENRGWNLLGKQAGVLSQTTQNNQPYYMQNPVMGGVGSVLSAIGTIKGMGNGQSNPGQDNGRPNSNWSGSSGGGSTDDPYGLQNNGSGFTVFK